MQTKIRSAVCNEEHECSHMRVGRDIASNKQEELVCSSVQVTIYCSRIDSKKKEKEKVIRGDDE